MRRLKIQAFGLMTVLLGVLSVGLAHQFSHPTWLIMYWAGLGLVICGVFIVSHGVRSHDEMTTLARRDSARERASQRHSTSYVAAVLRGDR